MDPEGARLLTYPLYAYGKPRLPPVHKYSSLRSTAHRAVARCVAGRCRDSEGSARNSCITHTELTSGHGLASCYS